MISGIVRTGPGTSASTIPEGADYRFPVGNTDHTSPSSVDQESLRYAWTIPFPCMACWLMLSTGTALHLVQGQLYICLQFVLLRPRYFQNTLRFEFLIYSPPQK